MPSKFLLLVLTSFALPILSAQERIISLAPHITEVLYQVGAGSEIVGTVDYSDYPEVAQEIPRIGSFNRLSYESIIAMQPTLVIAWQSGNGEESIQRLEELGLNVYSHEPKSLEDVAESLRIFGELSGHQEEGLRQSQAFLARLASQRANSRSADPSRPVLSLYYQLGNEPQMTLNGTHLVSDVIELCGGRNIFAEAIPLVPRVSIESVLRLNPEVIIATGPDAQRPEWLDNWYNWPSITAVQKDQLFTLDADHMHRHGPRILDGAESLCEILDQVRG